MKGRWLVALSNRKGPLSLKPLLASGGVSHISLRIEKQCAFMSEKETFFLGSLNMLMKCDVRAAKHCLSTKESRWH